MAYRLGLCSTNSAFMDMGGAGEPGSTSGLSGTIVLDPGMTCGSIVFIFQNVPDSREPVYITDSERRDQRKVTQAASVSGKCRNLAGLKATSWVLPYQQDGLGLSKLFRFIKWESYKKQSCDVCRLVIKEPVLTKQS